MYSNDMTQLFFLVHHILLPHIISSIIDTDFAKFVKSTL